MPPPNLEVLPAPVPVRARTKRAQLEDAGQCRLEFPARIARLWDADHRPAPRHRRTDDRLARARQLLADGCPDRAIELVAEALDRNPSSSEAHLLVGSARLLQKQFLSARVHLGIAVSLDPLNADAALNLVLSLQGLGHHEAAAAARARYAALVGPHAPGADEHQPVDPPPYG